MKSGGRLFVSLILFTLAMTYVEAEKCPGRIEFLTGRNAPPASHGYARFSGRAFPETDVVGSPGAGVVSEIKSAEGAVQPDSSRFRIGLIFGRMNLNDKNLTAYYGHKGRYIPGLELSIRTKFNIDLWASYQVYSDKQKTSVYGDTVKFKLTPLSIGLRYRPSIWRSIEPFVGAGLNFYFYSETISGEHDLENTDGKASGFYLQGGFYFHINRFRFLLGEIFWNYDIVKKSLLDVLPDGSNKLDLGGFEIGIGLVVRF